MQGTWRRADQRSDLSPMLSVFQRTDGGGDVKLAFVMGLYLTGERIMGALFYGTVLCCIYSIVQLIRKKLTLKNGVPMTPFLFLGTFITLLIQ